METIKVGQTWRTRNGEQVIIDAIEPWWGTSHKATTICCFVAGGRKRTVWADGIYVGRGSSVDLDPADLVQLIKDPTKAHRQEQLRLFDVS